MKRVFLAVSVLCACGLVIGAEQAGKGRVGEERLRLVREKCVMRPDMEVVLGFRTDGEICEVAEEGASVKKDQVVARLRDERLKLEVQRYELAVNDTTEMREQEIRLTYWENSLEIIRKLREKEALSPKELLDAELSRDVAKVGIDRAKVNNETAKVLLSQAQELLEASRITSPFDGVVRERFRKVGEAVQRFEPVLSLMKVDVLQVEVVLEGRYYYQLKVGEKAKVRVPDAGDRVVEGRVSYISPFIDAGSQEFKIKVAVENPEWTLKPGLYATVEIEPGPSDSPR